MNKTWWIAIPGILALIAVCIVIALLLVNYSLAWTIPDLFPGAVAQGLVAESISSLEQRNCQNSHVPSVDRLQSSNMRRKRVKKL